MTTTPLPSYGIWTTDMEGKRVMGFTPEQFLSVWQARADLEAENARLRDALGAMQQHVEELCTVYGVPLPQATFDKARAALESKT